MNSPNKQAQKTNYKNSQLVTKPSKPRKGNSQNSPQGGFDDQKGKANGPVEQKVDLSVKINPHDIGRPELRPTVPILRETNAGDIAKLIVYTFAGSLLAAFNIIILIIILIIKLPSDISSNILSNIEHAFEILKLVSTIFSPLLAFLLGYYFSQSTKAR